MPKRSRGTRHKTAAPLSLVVERRTNAPLNGELLRQRLVGGAKMRAAQLSAGASRRLAVWLR